MPSRPGELHPEPLTEPDMNLSIHPARAIARRLPSSIDHQALPAAGHPTAVDLINGDDPLPSLHGHYTRFVTTTKQSVPSRRIVQPRGWSRLCLFPWHRRVGSHVPYKSLVELRAAYTPDATWAVSGHPPS